MALALDSDEVKAASLIWAKADRDTRKRMRAEIRPLIVRLRGDIASAGKSAQDRRIARTARIGTTRDGWSVIVGRSNRRLPGGATVRELTRVQEFGGNREYRLRYPTRRGSTRYPTTRHTQRMIPWHQPKGRLVYPAVGKHGAQIVTGWVRAIVEGYYEHG